MTAVPNPGEPHEQSRESRSDEQPRMIPPSPWAPVDQTGAYELGTPVGPPGSVGPVGPVGPVSGAAVHEPPRRKVPRWADRKDLVGGATVVVAMVATGLLLGVVWYLVAPRLAFRVGPSGDFLPVGAVESEALIGADGWFVALTALVGLVAGLAGWLWRSVRGPAVAVGLAAGGVVGALVASWIGHLLGHGPS
ncbi:MAG TPA: hypothetical protein VIS06_21310, partial [Mycobacteriales bacterium]